MPEAINVFGLQIDGLPAAMIVKGFGILLFATAVAIAFAWSVYDDQVRQSRDRHSDSGDDHDCGAVEDLQLRTNT